MQQPRLLPIQQSDDNEKYRIQKVKEERGDKKPLIKKFSTKTTIVRPSKKTNKAIVGDSCIICTDTYESGDKIAFLHEKKIHNICLDCFDKLESNHCPICRDKIIFFEKSEAESNKRKIEEII